MSISNYLNVANPKLARLTCTNEQFHEILSPTSYDIFTKPCEVLIMKKTSEFCYYIPNDVFDVPGHKMLNKKNNQTMSL